MKSTDDKGGMRQKIKRVNPMIEDNQWSFTIR